MTKRQLIVLFVIAVFLLAAGCRNEQTNTTTNGNGNANSNRATSQSTPDEFAAVKVIFTKDCQECHGANGEGGPVTLKDGTKLKVPTLRSGHALRHNDAEFVKQITKGGDGMPAFADKLKTEEINALIKFIRKEFQGGATPAAK
jgi:mono/diheme cytochrome c family protein